jgi:hypothetical protein
MNKGLATTTLELTASEAFPRLRELCQSGRYKYIFSWDKFANGFMITCSITSLFQSSETSPIRKRLLIKKTIFHNSTDLHTAKNHISRVILDELGLPLNNQNEEDTNDDSFRVNETALYNTMEQMTKQLPDMVSQTSIYKNMENMVNNLPTIAADMMANMMSGNMVPSKNWSDLSCDQNSCEHQTPSETHTTTSPNP